eukprot:m.9743 g.9743  ORF g.9743 m.9743 type:complete len:307 (-) comp7254_c0_seq1:47-967(-)
MRLVQFKTADNTTVRVGVELERDGDIADVTATDAAIPAEMKALLAAGTTALDRCRSAAESNKNVLPRASVTLMAPVYGPEKIVCIGMNYVDHCTEQNMPVPDEPVVFSKFASCITEPGAPIIKPDITDELDFEVELAIVIGKTAKNVKASDAMDYVAGYTVAHDVSARDWQIKKNGGQWLAGKTFDTFAPIGPAIVTKDAISDPHKLGIRCRLNGETVQDSNTKQLVFKTEAIIEWVSKLFTLKPGDLIFTGTPPGVGCFRKPQLWLKPGDVVDCEIDEIGCITNPVKAETSAKASEQVSKKPRKG